MKIYLSGPMRGYPNLNKEMFDHYASTLHDAEVFNPAMNGEMSLRHAFAIDAAWICNVADAIAMIPGWEKSLGARAEHALATAIGLPIIYLAIDDDPRSR